MLRRYEVLEEICKDPRASIRELCKRLRIKSPSHVHGLLCELEAEGLISREPGLARSISLSGSRRAKSEMKARRTASVKKTVRSPRPAKRRVGDRKCDEGWKNNRQTAERLQERIEMVASRAATDFTGGWVLREHRQ